MNSKGLSSFKISNRPFSVSSHILMGKKKSRSSNNDPIPWSRKDFGKNALIPDFLKTKSKKSVYSTKDNLIFSNLEHTREKYQIALDELQQYKTKVNDVRDNMNEIMNSRKFFQTDSLNGYNYTKKNPKNNKIEELRVPLVVKECSLKHSTINIEMCKNPNKLAKYSNIYNSSNVQDKLIEVPQNLISSLAKTRDCNVYIDNLSNQIYESIFQVKSRYAARPDDSRLSQVDHSLLNKLISKVKLNDKQSVLKFLKLNPKIVNLRDRCGKYVIHYACEYSQYSMCKILIYYKADIDREDILGNRPIDIVYRENNIRLIKVI